MKFITRAATSAALSVCIFAAGVHTAPLFAAEAPVFAAPAEIVQPLPIEPAVEIENASQSDEVPARQPRFTTLSAMVEAEDTAGALSAEEECLAGAVFFEAKSESLEGQHAVADVLINRAASGRFPGTLCGVLKQRGQFSFIRGGRMPAINRASRDWREAVAIAKIAMADRWSSAAPEALFFHARRVSPGWRLKRVATVGNHVFYR